MKRPIQTIVAGAMVSCMLLSPRPAAAELASAATIISLGVAALGKMASLHVRSHMSGADPMAEAVFQTREIVIRNQEQLLALRDHVQVIEEALIGLARRLDELPREIQQGVRNELTIRVSQKYIGAIETAYEKLLAQERGALPRALDLQRLIETIEIRRNELRQRRAVSVAPLLIAYLVLEGRLQVLIRTIELRDSKPEERKAKLQALLIHLNVDIYTPKLVDLWERLEHGEKAALSALQAIGEKADGEVQLPFCGSDTRELDQGLRQWHKLEGALGAYMATNLNNLDQFQQYVHEYYPAEPENRPAECKTSVFCTGGKEEHPISVPSHGDHAEEAIRENCHYRPTSLEDIEVRSGTISRCALRSALEMEPSTTL